MLLKNLTTRRLAGVANFGSYSGVVTKLTRTKGSVVEINWRIVLPTGFAESSSPDCHNCSTECESQRFALL